MFSSLYLVLMLYFKEISQLKHSRHYQALIEEKGVAGLFCLDYWLGVTKYTLIQFKIYIK
jgi:hypothetical protein